ncbi:hypothetical protein ACFSUS_05955 [Spirosoma soli]|uniref:Uncharacterized protein n=1 Tax=Spirosoma soli TaxID=1770529 RepID=A0ABW5M0V6_9BACT
MSTGLFGSLLELISIISGGLAKLTPAQLGLTFAAAVGITTLCAWVCLHYVQLWNKRFQLTMTHKVLTALACTLTFFFVLAFAGLAFMKEVTLARITIWQATIKIDPVWSRETLHKTYESVKKIGKEDFSNFPSYEVGVPISQSESKLIVAETYSNEACKNFDAQHPFLSKVVWASPNVPTRIVQEDVEAYFKNKQGQVYPTERAVDLAADHIKTQLTQQAPRVVTLSRIGLVIAFLLVQLIPFGLIGYAAYTDIRSSFKSA